MRAKTDVEKTIYENERLDSMPGIGHKPDKMSCCGDILTTAERMAQFDDDAKQTQARATAQANLSAMRNTLASAISDQLVDFDIQGPGEATCWLNDLEVGLEFEYEVDSEGPEPTTHHIQIVGSWSQDNWGLIELTPALERQAEADLLKIYPQWIEARRSEEGE